MGGPTVARLVVVCTAVLLVALPVAAGAEDAPAPAPSPAPPVSVPPPPAFRLPLDEGRRLLDQRARAIVDLASLEPQLWTATVRRDELQQRVDRLQAQLRELRRERERTVAELEDAKDRLAASAARAYVHSGSGRITAVFDAVTRAEDALDAGRDLYIISTYGEHEIDVVEGLEEEIAELDDEIDAVDARRARVQRQLDDANEYVRGVQAVVDDARRRLEEAEAGIARFHALADTAGSPIMGPNRLTAEDLADFVRAGPVAPRITVSIEELAQYYIEESEKLGIRGDVAFAQSILETGYFGFHGSMVEPEDNNFAGIGACDSCRRGFQFPDARTGVRAQMQLLRVYVDPTVTEGSLPDPLLMPRTLRLGFRGDVQSWWDLTGTWATAHDYGIRVYDLYLKIVAASGKPAP